MPATSKIIEATERLRAAQSAYETAQNEDQSCGYHYNKENEPSSINERYWIDAIAATRDVKYDPVVDTFFHFEGGIWEKRTRAEMREIISQHIRVNTSEELGVNLDKVLSKSRLDPLVERLTGHRDVVHRNAFANPPLGVVLTRSGRISLTRAGDLSYEAGNMGQREDLRTSRLDVDYAPDAKASLTLSWLNRIFCDREDDVQAIAKAIGACLYGASRWKKMVVIHGKADLGKSLIPELIERLIGAGKTAEFETRRLGEKFEMRRFVGKVFLRAADVDADFMTRTYADVLKQLTGGDALRVENKSTHDEFELRGDKLVMATSNFCLRVKADVDRSAWESRLVYLKADGEPYREDEQNIYFLDDVFADEGEKSGLLNFGLAGLVDLLKNGWTRSETQMLRIKAVMDDAGNVTRWAREAVVNEPGDPQRPGITISEAWTDYRLWCGANQAQEWPERIFREMAVEAIKAVWTKTTSDSIRRNDVQARGWRGLSLKSKLDEIKARKGQYQQGEE